MIVLSPPTSSYNLLMAIKIFFYQIQSNVLNKQEHVLINLIYWNYVLKCKYIYRFLTNKTIIIKINKKLQYYLKNDYRPQATYI